jgi:hypothetical protein
MQTVFYKTHRTISTFWSRYTVTGQGVQFSPQTELLRMGSWTGHCSHLIQSYFRGGCNYGAGLKHISLKLNGLFIGFFVSWIENRTGSTDAHIYTLCCHCTSK